MPTKIHELRAVITANTGKFTTAIGKARKDLAGFGTAFGQLNKSTGVMMTRMGIAVAGLGISIGKTFANFEATMVRAGSVTGATGAEFTKLSQAAKDMGESTVFSASQAAEAIEQMGLAGLSTTEIIEALPGALQLAAAGQVSIAEAANTAAKTMRAFGADASELTHINDVMVATFTRANTTLGQLGEALKPVAPVSKALGVSLEDTAAVIAKLSDAGFQASLAGTSLRNILSKLAGATPEAITKLKNLGIVTQDSAGNMRPFLDILEDIETQGLKDADILQIFGARGGPQLLALLEVGTGAIRNFSSELEASGGIAQRIADANLGTLNGMFTLLWSKVEGIAIAVGEKLAPTFRNLSIAIGEALEGNRDQLVDQLSEALTWLAERLVDLVRTIGEAGPAMAQWAASFAAMLKPVLSFIANNPKLVAAFVAFKASGLSGMTAVLGDVARLMRSVLSISTRFVTMPALIMAVVYAVGQLMVKMTGLQENLEEGAKLDQKLEKIKAKRARNAVQDAGEIVDPDEKRAKLKAMHERLRIEKKGIEDRIRMDKDERKSKTNEARPSNGRMDGLTVAENSVMAPLGITAGNDTGSPLIKGGQYVMGTNGAEDFDQDIANKEMRVDEIDRMMENLENQAKALNKELADNKAAGTGSSLAADVEARAVAVELSPKTDENIAKSIQAAQDAKQDSKTPGFSEIRDFMSLDGVTGQDAADLASANGVPEDVAGDLGYAFDQLKADGDLTAQSIRQLALDFASFNAQTADTQNRLDVADQGWESFADSLQQTSDRMTEDGVDFDAQTTSFIDKFGELEQALHDGTISTDEFTSSSRDLAMAARDAAMAAREEAAEKQREQLLKPYEKQLAGITDPNMKQTVEDQLIAMEKQKLAQAAGQIASQLFGIANPAQSAANSLNKFDKQVQKTGKNLSKSMPGGGQSAQKVGKAINTLFAFLNSKSGKIQTLVNNISLMKQTLSVMKTFRKRQARLKVIEDMERQLLALLNDSKQPVLTLSRSFDPDPGLVTVNVSANFPDVRNINSGQMRQLGRMLTDEARRSGTNFHGNR